jgi:hypothetical protein
MAKMTLGLKVLSVSAAEVSFASSSAAVI